MRKRFFASGEQYVTELLRRVRRQIDPAFQPERVLDFGCGVGRVLIPLARLARQTVGIDVSPSMLNEARRNCDALALSGVELVTPDALRGLGRFDLVHSVLVLQHMPVRDGERILAELVDVLSPGGVGVIQLTIGGNREHLVFNALMKAPLAPNVLNLVRGRPWSYPHMQMNVYDLNRLLPILRARGVPLVHVNLGDPFGGYEDCTLLFERSSAAATARS